MFKYHPIDVHVGLRLRQRRTLLGISQTALGKVTKMTFQQVQKYEKGANRISSSYLYEFARALDVPVDYFFEGLPGAAARTPTRADGENTPHPAPARENDLMNRRETYSLVRAYYKIRRPDVRREILGVVKALAK